MLHELTELIPGIAVKGTGISQYAIEHKIKGIRPHVQVAGDQDLPLPDNSFGVVISINTIHNLERKECA